MRILIRPTVAQLDDAMDNLKEFQNEKHFKQFMDSQFKNWRVDDYCDFEDDRIGWQITKLVIINDYPVYFLTEGLTKEKSLKIFKKYQTEK